MVYRLKMISNEVKNFVRDIEISSGQTFFDLHKIIQEDLHYDNTQIASFFLTNYEWEKIIEFTLFDMTDNGKIPTIPMEKAILSDHMKDKLQRILYIFDFFNERAFFIELMAEIKNPEPVEYPRIIYSRGNPPRQILFELNFPLSADPDEE